MDKKSGIIIGISIIIGFIILGGMVVYTFKDTDKTDGVGTNRYEMVTPNDSNIIIFDKETGRYWRKFINSDGGPTEWEEEISPILNK